MKVIIVSGYWNPIHIGHIAYLREAKKLGDYLIVIVNNDNQVKLKGSVPFMNEKERVEIVKAIKYVDEVILSNDIDKTVCCTLCVIEYRYFDDEVFFVKGGDRNLDNIPEKDTCNRLNIKMIFDVGGSKLQSSSTLIKKARRKRENN